MYPQRQTEQGKPFDVHNCNPLLNLAWNQSLGYNLVKEVAEREDDQLCLFLIEEVEIHHNNGSVEVVSPSHIDDPGIQDFLYLLGQRDISMSLPPIVISLNRLISLLRLVILIGPEEDNLLVRWVHVALNLLEILLELPNKFKFLRGVLDIPIKEDSFILDELIFVEVEIAVIRPVEDRFRLHWGWVNNNIKDSCGELKQNQSQFLILNMRKYQSQKTGARPDSEYSIPSKKKSLFQQIPSIFLKAVCQNTPKASLQFRSHEADSHLNVKKYETNAVKSSTKIPKTPYEKSQKKDKENKVRSKKYTKKALKDELKPEDKKILPSKSKPEQPILKHCTNQAKRQQTKKLNSLVTQFEEKELATKPAPVQLGITGKKLQLPYYISTLINAFSSQSNTFKELAKSHLMTSLQLLEYTKRLVKPSYVKPSMKLPKTARNTIVFDLDETLIHCNQGNQDKPYDVALDIKFPNGDMAQAKINIRPYAKQCLQQLSQYFNIIVFTASHSCYANAVINHLDPESKYISHRFFRESCYHTPEGMYIKDLRIIDRPLNSMLLIDNAAYSYCFQIENGIPIVPFYDNKSDTQLKSLTNYLKMFALSLNIKSQHCKILKTDKYNKYTDPKSLITQLYSDYLY